MGKRATINPELHIAPTPTPAFVNCTHICTCTGQHRIAEPSTTCPFVQSILAAHRLRSRPSVVTTLITVSIPG